MVIDAAIQSVGVREMREELRVVLARVHELGEPILVLQHGQPAAMLIRHEEAERWARIDRALSAFHGLELYPETVKDTRDLAAVVRGELSIPPRHVGPFADDHEIGWIPQTIGIADLRANIADHLSRVGQGRLITVVDGGRLTVSLISPAEFDRLRSLGRIVSWFRAAGLDMATANEAEIVTFVKTFRERGTGAGEAGALAG